MYTNMVQVHEQINNMFFVVFKSLVQSNIYFVHVCAASTMLCPALSFSITFMFGPSLINHVMQ